MPNQPMLTYVNSEIGIEFRTLPEPDV